MSLVGKIIFKIMPSSVKKKITERISKQMANKMTQMAIQMDNKTPLRNFGDFLEKYGEKIDLDVYS